MNRRMDRLSETLRMHWLALLVGAVFIYTLLPFLAPVLVKLGARGAAQVLYTPYKAVCHTWAFRSFFLFGERVEHPRANGDGIFEQASGIDPTTADGLNAARDFIGNEQMGYKVALCERDLAIYASLGLNGLAFALVRRRARQLPWAAFVLIGLVPVGLDGFSQLFSQPPFDLLPFFNQLGFRESTWWLRLITGSLFGTSVAWLIFPLIQSAFDGDAPRE
ncbi:MAG: DUF2085 domain-containing protein [Anaerolineae bacterium]|nr:DUF2085 domain-containing protein [Anaerolineae bacterium]